MRKYILTLCVMFFATISAQQFHGASLFDCFGDVKEIKYEKKYPLLKNKKWSFTNDGKLNKSLLTYNEQGYPAGAGFSMGNQGLNLNIEYDRDNHIKTLSLQSNVLGKCLNMSVEFVFNGNQMVEMTADIVSKDSNKTMVFKYSDYKFDSRGNWVERSVAETSFNKYIENPSAASEETRNYVEKRSIRYYNN